MNATIEGIRTRLGSKDIGPVLLILVLPLLLAAPLFVGISNADPLASTGWIVDGLERGALRGVPHLDPNSGFTTQALGHLAATLWVQGAVPWWNYYTGVGLPLAGEYQPAAFFPLTLLLLFPNGMLMQLLALQWLAGVGTYGLLRQMGLLRVAALTGAILFEFNGTLAWFSHGPAQALPFLPWILWGIERAARTAVAGGPGGWRTLALGIAGGLLAGFPETAYIDGLLALAWTVVRGLELRRGPWRAFLFRIALGGSTGLLIAMPQIWAFFDYLPEAEIDEHGAQLATAALEPIALLPTLIAPYLFGPPMAFVERLQWLPYMWGAIGGYVTLAMLVAAAYGWGARRGAMGWLLAVWTILALARTFGAPGLPALWNLIPGVSLTAFYRYAPPSWEMAVAILAAWGVDAVAQDERLHRGPLLVALSTLGIGVALGVIACAPVLSQWREIGQIRNWALGSILWALGATVALLVFAAVRNPRAMAALLVFDAMLMFAIPTLANPRGGIMNASAISFLQEHLGLQRFYSLGPIQPNYGAYFGIASINYNYLPNSTRWVAWVRAHLDRGADSVVFNGTLRDPKGPPPAEELRRNLASFQEAGVKYVVTPAGTNPLEGVAGVRKVHESGGLHIFELPMPSPYFVSVSGFCKVFGADRERVVAECDQPDKLVRRELFFPGWQATLGTHEAQIVEHDGVFQSVELPSGRSELRFTYAPRHAAWAWLSALAGCALLVVPGLGRRFLGLKATVMPVIFG